jgi:tetratricopeptide (TPR) repeat protein
MSQLANSVQASAAEVPGNPHRRRRLRWVLALAMVLVIGGGVGGRQLWAWNHWRAARKALGRYDFAEALEHFECCLRVWPGSPAMRLEALRTARRGNRIDRFNEYLAACEKDGSTEGIALEQAMLHAQQGELADVEGPLMQLIHENHPGTPLIAEALFHGFMQSFRLGHARFVVDVLLQHEPDHPWAHFWRASLLEDSARLPDAILDYRRAYELDPRHREFRVRLAQALVQNGQADRAWTHVSALLQEAPTDPDVLLAAAKCQRDLGDNPGALRYLETLLREHPDHVDGWAERGLILGDQGDLEESIRCLRRAFDLDPRKYRIGFALFNELHEQGRHPEARGVWEKIERRKHDGERLEEIVIQLSKDDRNVALRHELGVLSLRNDAEATALRWFASVLQIDPGYEPTHAALAEYYQRKGDSAGAEYHRKRAGKAKP